jgi:hypothetical protein
MPALLRRISVRTIVNVFLKFLVTEVEACQELIERDVRVPPSERVVKHYEQFAIGMRADKSPEGR